jgi:hypothetical protein
MDLAQVGVRVVADGVADTKAQIESVTPSLEGIAKKMTGIGQKMSLGITAPIAAFGVKSFMLASDVGESVGKLGVIFEGATDDVVAFSKAAVDTFGMSSLAAMDATGNFGNLFKTMGVGAEGLTLPLGKLAGDISGLNAQMLDNMDPVAAMSESFTALAGDLSSFTNIPVADVLANIQSGLVGEAEPLRKYGILINEASVQQKALELGIWDGVSAMTEQQKVLARGALILEQSGTAHGDAARTADSAANSFRRFQANLTEFSIMVGEVMLPIGTKLFQWGTKILKQMREMSPTMLKVAIVVGAVAAAMGPLLIVLGSVLGAASAVAAAFGTGGILASLTPLLGPIALVVAALVGLGIAYKTNFLGFADAVNWVAGKVKDLMMPIVDTIGNVVEGVKLFANAFSALQEPLGTAEAAIYALQIVFPQFSAQIAKIFGPLKSMMGGLQGISVHFERLFNIFKNNGFMAGIHALFGKEGLAILQNFGKVIGGLPKIIGQALRNIHTGFKPIDAILKNLGSAFILFGSIIQKVFRGDFSGALDSYFALLDRMKNIGSIVFDLLLRGFNAINWGAVLETFGQIITFIPGLIGDFLTEFKTGFKPFDDLINGIGEQMSGIVDIVQGIFTGDFAKIFEGAKQVITGFIDVIKGIGGLVLEAARAIPWSDIIAGALDLAGQAIGLMGSLADKAWTWFTEAVEGIDWGALIAGALDLAQKAIDKMTPLAGKVWSWFREAVDGIDWLALISGAAGLAEKAVGKFGALAGKVVGWIRESIPGADTWLALIVAAAGLAQKAIDAFGTLADKVITWIRGSIPGVDSWFAIVAGAAGLAAEAIRRMGDLAGAVKNWIGAVASAVNWGSVFNVVTSAFDKVGDAIGDIQGIVTDVKDTVGSAAGSIGDALAGIWDFSSDALGKLQSAIEAIGGAAETAWGFVQKLPFVGGGGGEGGPVTDAEGRPYPTYGSGLVVGDAYKGEASGNPPGAAIAMPDITALTQAAADAVAAGAAIGETMTTIQTDIALGITAITDFSNAASAGFQSAATNTDANLDVIDTRLGQEVITMGVMGKLAGEAFKNELNTPLSQSIIAVGIILDGISSKLGTFVKTASAMGTAGGKQFKDNLISQLSQALAGVQAIFDAIAQKMGSLANTANSKGYATGSSFGQGMWLGMNAWLRPIMDKAAQLVNDSERAARDAADAKSPSRKFRFLGNDMGLGAVLGVQDLIPAMRSATGDLVAAGIGEYSTGPVKARSALTGGSARHITQHVHQYQVTPERLTKLMSDAQDSVEFIETLYEETGVR